MAPREPGIRPRKNSSLQKDVSSLQNRLQVKHNYEYDIELQQLPGDHVTGTRDTRDPARKTSSL